MFMIRMRSGFVLRSHSKGEVRVPAKILDGRLLAEQIRTELANEVAMFRQETGVTPGLAAVLVGQESASEVYVRNKRSACRTAGMRDELHRLPRDVTASQLFDLVDRLNEDRSVHGNLVQLPLPPQIDESHVIARIVPYKDVDGFHPENVGLLSIGRPRFVPCTPLGIQEMLIRGGIRTRG